MDGTDMYEIIDPQRLEYLWNVAGRCKSHTLRDGTYALLNSWPLLKTSRKVIQGGLGRNQHRLEPLLGDGPFVVEEESDDSYCDYVFRYTRSRNPIHGLVFNGLVDYVRAITETCLIGEIWWRRCRVGYFLLVHEHGPTSRRELDLVINVGDALRGAAMATAYGAGRAVAAGLALATRAATQPLELALALGGGVPIAGCITLANSLLFDTISSLVASPFRRVFRAGRRVENHNGSRASCTTVVVRPTDRAELLRALDTCIRQRRPCTVVGTRHSEGGQHNWDGGVSIDMCGMDRVLELQRDARSVTVEAGITWLALNTALKRETGEALTFPQKQTGAEKISVGGSVSANMHGRGLGGPLADDIEQMEVLVLRGGRAESLVCSRDENADLFAACIGGYGMFGVIYSVRLRLVPDDVVEIVTTPFGKADSAQAAVLGAVADAQTLNMDIWYTPTDMQSGFVTTYEKRAADHPRSSWYPHVYNYAAPFLLAERPRLYARTFRSLYPALFRGTLKLSDTHYFVDRDHYEAPAQYISGTDVVYGLFEAMVPARDFDRFYGELVELLSAIGLSSVYGVLRFVAKAQTPVLLDYATEDQATCILNIPCSQFPGDKMRTKRQVRRVIDLVIAFRGHFHLAYAQYATPAQLAAAFGEDKVEGVRSCKRKYDPACLLKNHFWQTYFAP